MAPPIRFENLKRPALNTPLSEIEVEGVRLDLHHQLRMVGLTFGLEPTAATLGWAATGRLMVIRRGRALPISGLALHFVELSRFEVAFAAEPPGQLEYLEVRSEPDPELLFFFEAGTIRIGCAFCRAELVTDADEEEGIEPPPGLLQ